MDGDHPVHVLPAGAIELAPITVELTYGLSAAMFCRSRITPRSAWSKASRTATCTSAIEQSKFNFEQSRPELLFQWFEQYAEESRRLCGVGLPLPAYDYCMKCSHTFNLLDARGAISVAERAQYIKRVRDLALLCAQTWVGEPAP
jgi:glycyl-tRNA synthetase alpha chain